MRKIIALFLLLTIGLLNISCNDVKDVEKHNTTISESEIMQNIDSYFDVAVEFQNIEWDSNYNNFFGVTYHTGTSDMHIKVINKKHIDGISVTVQIKIKNSGDNANWVDAKYLEEEVIEKTIYIVSQGVTDIVIPRSTDAPDISKDRVPNSAEITVEIIHVSIET